MPAVPSGYQFTCAAALTRAEGVAEDAVADASARVVDARPHQKRPSVFVFEPPAEHALWPVQPLADLRAEFVRRPERALACA
jgi:hypothetical protein